LLVVDEQQSGTRIDVRPGEVLAIRLKESASTGYRWAVENADGLALEERGHADRGTAPRAAGFHEFRFRAAGPGTHQLRLKHWRDWEGEGSIIGSYLIDARFG
jgi:inhibitor of cysteine peptidase